MISSPRPRSSATPPKDRAPSAAQLSFGRHYAARRDGDDHADGAGRAAAGAVRKFALVAARHVGRAFGRVARLSPPKARARARNAARASRPAGRPEERGRRDGGGRLSLAPPAARVRARARAP